MHEFTMPQWAIDRVKQRREKIHVFDDMVPSRTALVVVDLQNGFMVPEHTPMPVATAIGTVPKVNQLAATLRKTGGKVFWIKNTIDESNLESWSNWFAMGKPAMKAQRVETFKDGAPGHDIYPDLEVKPEDEIVKKFRFSAFLPESSDIAERLRAQGFDTVLIVGTVTNVCCESSARDAMMMNFKTIMVSDGNSAFSDHEHTATLAAFYSIFGDVMETDEVCMLLERNAGALPIAAE
ncbi:cysteine hydrolase [Methylocella sp. CPCC 101449]|jgi:ureidoacrylate peracid hydrolase|uniref:cysteine hydrolase n=1 Tax=Methylocella sp. CPCC 101449 TaxID=2987531 RepID=UPI00288D3260|nr:cysteine hydrolase [Methylocella sp. CPCC 101449]MDT2019995.1 cysteine hydrolase [Methylocella sp. CPCC 101449]HEV2575067.1 cysteine hydrolase [Beijerinckiaceae bacterium]